MNSTTQTAEEKSRVSGEIFIARQELLKLPGRKTKIGRRFYKHFAPTALAIVVAFLFSSHAAFAQRRTPAAIPSPRSVLGFNPGDDRTIADWKQISDYFARLDRASERVQLQTIGKSTLGRTIFVAFISAPENIRNLEKYKAIQAKLADPRKVTSDAAHCSRRARHAAPLQCP